MWMALTLWWTLMLAMFNTGHMTEADLFSLYISLNLHYIKTGSN
jgi:hypothetical protein